MQGGSGSQATQEGSQATRQGTRNYDQRPFKLHGRIDMTITFGGRVLTTPVYIKMDTEEPLLLSEGVC